MYETNIGLKHLISRMHHQELLSEAERRRMAALALEAGPRRRRRAILDACTFLTTRLLRAGSWLRPAAVVSSGT
jgi:hypothetical protein